MYDLGSQFKYDINKSTANPECVFRGDKYRITILTERLVRLEYNDNGYFEDYPTELIWYRNFAKPEFTVSETDKTLKIIILIYGTSIFFYLISIIILNYLNTKKLYIIINILFDLTKGIQTTSLITNQTIKDLIIILLLTISPLNINIQIKSILSDTNIKYKNFIKGRITSFILTIIIYILIRS